MTMQLMFGEMNADDIGQDIALRVIDHVRGKYQADLDALAATIKHGGTIPEMRAAVRAYDVLAGVLRELKTATEMIIHQEERNE